MKKKSADINPNRLSFFQNRTPKLYIIYRPKLYFKSQAMSYDWPMSAKFLDLWLCNVVCMRAIWNDKQLVLQADLPSMKKNRQPKPQILLYKKSSLHYFIWRTLFNATAKDKRFP
jgi:hypothetical protein